MKETKFKHTEIGLIPHDWEVRPLYDLCEFRNGYTPSKAIKDYWENGTIPWFRMEDIRINGRILSDAIQHITPQAVKGGGLFEADSIIMSTTATIGEHARLIADSLANQRFTNLKIRKSQETNLAISFFFYYCFILGEWCRNNINEGGLAAVNMQDFANVMIPLPPTLAEQERIADALSKIDNLISNLDALIEKKKAIKTGTMQQLLTGKKRLKGFIGEWVSQSIGDLVGKIKRGHSLQSKDYKKGIVPVVAGGKQYAGFHNVANHLGNTITISGSGANAGYVALHTTPIFATDCSVIDEEENFDLEFIYFVLLNKQSEIYKLQSGGAQPHIYPKNIEDLITIFPPTIEEQHAIASILSSMDTEIAALEQKRDKYTAIKQGMMQQLLTGRIRLLEEDTQEQLVVPTIQPLPKQRTANVFFRRSVFDNVINTMADWDTEQCEIVATLYSAWEDLLHSGKSFTDDDILNELYHRWHDSKKRFTATRLLSALTWMRQNNFIPKK